MPCGATKDGQVMVERFDRMWSTGEGNGKPLQYSSLENPMNSMNLIHMTIISTTVAKNTLEEILRVNKESEMQYSGAISTTEPDPGSFPRQNI